MDLWQLKELRVNFSDLRILMDLRSGLAAQAQVAQQVWRFGQRAKATRENTPSGEKTREETGTRSAEP